MKTRIAALALAGATLIGGIIAGDSATAGAASHLKHADTPTIQTRNGYRDGTYGAWTTETDLGSYALTAWQTLEAGDGFTLVAYCWPDYCTQYRLPQTGPAMGRRDGPVGHGRRDGVSPKGRKAVVTDGRRDGKPGGGHGRKA